MQFPLFRQLHNRAKQPRPGVNRQCGTDRTDEARYHVEPLHQAVAEFHGIVICRAMHHRQTHLVTLKRRMISSTIAVSALEKPRALHSVL